MTSYRNRRVYKRLNEVRDNSPVFCFNNNSKIVIMSDCHRGVTNWADNFDTNSNIYFAALQYYYKAGYSYIELGDGDELWENRNLDQIITSHSDVYWILSNFYFLGRLLFIYGNHDRVKQSRCYVQQYYDEYYNACEKRMNELFPEIVIYEGVRLKNKDTGKELLLAHGHQGDLLNDSLWKLGRFLVRYVWRPLELFGVNDPTSAAKNYRKANKIEKGLSSWAEKYNQILITGHTHRPHVPELNLPDDTDEIKNLRKTVNSRNTGNASNAANNIQNSRNTGYEKYSEYSGYSEYAGSYDSDYRRENERDTQESDRNVYNENKTTKFKNKKNKIRKSDISQTGKENEDFEDEINMMDSIINQSSMNQDTMNQDTMDQETIDPSMINESASNSEQHDRFNYIPYFNTGSCVHPRCITALEITNNEVCLVKWAIYTRPDNTLYVSCELLDGPVPLD